MQMCRAERSLAAPAALEKERLQCQTPASYVEKEKEVKKKERKVTLCARLALDPVSQPPFQILW